MYKILLVGIFFFSLITTIHAQELSDYCTDNNGSITCTISILPYPSYTQDYDPGIANIPSGATIIFKNAGYNVHTATSTNANPEQNSYYAVKEINGIFDTGTLTAGQTAKSFTIQNPGEYHYLCTIHDAMRGTIIVTGDGIPNWIRNNASWWSTGLIGDEDFVSGIQYLIKQEIISISTTSSAQTTDTTIPDWIRNTAGWWAEGIISDDEFTIGLEWMINNGIIQVQI